MTRGSQTSGGAARTTVNASKSPLAGPSIGIGGLSPDRGVEIGNHLLFAGHSGVVVHGDSAALFCTIVAFVDGRFLGRHLIVYASKYSALAAERLDLALSGNHPRSAFSRRTSVVQPAHRRAAKADVEASTKRSEVIEVFMSTFLFMQGVAAIALVMESLTPDRWTFDDENPTVSHVIPTNLGGGNRRPHAVSRCYFR